MTPEAVIGCKLMIDGLSLLFSAGRIYATRKIARTVESIAAHVCLLLAFGTNLTATGTFIWIMVQERKILDMFPNDPASVEKEAGNPDYIKIFFVAYTFYYLSLYWLKGAYLVRMMAYQMDDNT